jgi:pimeloyl-ACP methyl ester carboxylesterase
MTHDSPRACAAFREPVDVLGLSSGGSIALQLAAGHPDVAGSSRTPRR